ncbi:MAG: hypothetical protein M3O30_13575 [Planctomycetota bacterium]|nr:hypothetical protein [Planctomycetota bacterium]
MADMNAALLALGLVPLLVVCSVGPGLLVVRGLRWSPVEKLCGAMAASFILLYLASFVLFCFNAPLSGYWCAAGLFALAGVINTHQMVVLVRFHQSRRVLIAFAAILAWDFLHLAMIRSYSGGLWGGDWYEHYERTCYFLHQHSNSFRYLTIYLLPARPPMMNAIIAFFGRLVGMNGNKLSFESYSLCCVFLNAFAFLPCCLLLRHFAHGGMRYVYVLAILFMLNPSIMENVTWTITKAFAAGFVVLGVCFYLRGLRGKEPTRIIAAAIFLAGGCLVHYSAVPFAMGIAVHYLWVLATKRRGLLEPMIASLAGAALMASWFGWAIAHFEMHDTFFSNSTATGTVKLTTGENIVKILENLFTSLVPHPLSPIATGLFSRMQNLGDVRDYFFMMAQTTLPMMIGSASGLLAIYLFLFKKWPDYRERRFWLFFVPFTFILATATNPELERYGAGHIASQSLATMGVALVTAWLMEARGWVFWCVMAGLLVDYIFGVLLQFHLESRVHKVVADPRGRRVIRDFSLGTPGFYQYLEKLRMGFVFWGDHFAGASLVFQTLSIVVAAGAFAWLMRMRPSYVVALARERRVRRYHF